MEGGGNLKLTGSNGVGDYIYLYEGATMYMKFDDDGSYSIINGTRGHVTIDDCLRLDPVASLPSNPVEGMVCYYSVNSTLVCWTGAGWQGFW